MSEIKQCPSKDTFNIKLSVFYIIVYLCKKPRNTFLIVMIGFFVHNSIR